jgi:hypothetical protein
VEDSQQVFPRVSLLRQWVGRLLLAMVACLCCVYCVEWWGESAFEGLFVGTVHWRVASLLEVSTYCVTVSLEREEKSRCVITMLLVEKSWSLNLTPSSRGVCQPPVSGLLARSSSIVPCLIYLSPNIRCLLFLVIKMQNAMKAAAEVLDRFLDLLELH